MRIYLKTSCNDEVVSFDYQKYLVGVLHKWLGTNSEHDSISLYSFSWLHHGIKSKNGLDFPNGASWFISFYEDAKVKHIISSILKKPEMFAGMKVVDISIEETPNLESRSLFYLGSPIFIKRIDLDSKKTQHYTFDDSLSSQLMKETLMHKMEIAGLPMDDTLKIHFDLGYEKRRIKLVNYRGIKNKANICPIYIEGKPETKAFAWNVGIGNSTGIGFGSIY